MDDKRLANSGSTRSGGDPTGGSLAAGSAPLRVELLDSTGLLSEPVCAWLIDKLGEALGEACRREAHRGSGVARGGEVRVRVVGDGEMSRMHEEYAGVPGTTDVLTFDLSSDGEANAALDVDVVVCLDEAERQSRARGAEGRGERRAENELLLYALHGVLHCLGHDDHEPDAFRVMHAAEDEILRAIGVGPVFHRAETNGVTDGGGKGGSA